MSVSARVQFLSVLRPLLQLRLAPASSYAYTSQRRAASGGLAPVSSWTRRWDCEVRDKRSLLQSGQHVPVLLQSRFKKGKGKAASEDQEEKSDDEDEEEEEVEERFAEDWKDFDLPVINSRLDIVSKAALPVTRDQAVVLIANGLIRLNGRTAKKTDLVSDLDVLDLIRGRNKESPDKLDVVRAEIFAMSDHTTSKGRTKVKGRRWAQQTIDNYKEEPYEGQQLSQGPPEQV